MVDVLDALTVWGSEAEKDEALNEKVTKHVRRLRTTQPGARELVREVEKAVWERPEKAFTFDSQSNATLSYGDNYWNAGVFETVSLQELRKRTRAHGLAAENARVRLFLLDGASPFTDIGSLQATCGADTLFQVASQFNCLESPSAYVTPVANYYTDSTQGPRASISAFPATLLRHYCAPGEDGDRFVQLTHGRQLNLLSYACDSQFVKSGYLTGSDIDDSEKFIRQLDENFDKICVGVQSNVQVVYGYDWDGNVEVNIARPIAQVFTSTIAGGSYGDKALPEEVFRAASQRLLRAAYLGTLLAAVGLSRRRVVLTLIGGGVFRNKFEDIWNAIIWAIDEVQPLITSDLDVILNGYDLGRSVNLERVVKPDVQKRNGLLATFDALGNVRIMR